MIKLNIRYWLETDDFLNGTGENSRKIIEGISQLFYQILFHHWEPLLQAYHDWNFLYKRKFIVKNQPKCMQTNILIYFSLFVKVIIWTLET